MVEEPQVVVHEADQPDFFIDLFDADVLTGEDGREVDLAGGEADPAAHGDRHGAIVERVLEREDCGAVRVISVNHFGRSEYKEKGIADALLPHIRKLLDVPVSSSSNKRAKPGEYRTDAAIKIWKRLVTAGLAIHDDQADVFMIP